MQVVALAHGSVRKGIESCCIQLSDKAVSLRLLEVT